MLSVEHNVDLSRRTTLALPGRAARFAEVRSAEELTELASMKEPRRFVLGGGSNLVVRGDFDGLIVRMAIPGRALAGEDADAWYVRAGAGENWNDFVDWTLAQGWPGLENLALIPGTVGAAPIQNIGAYGLELAERFHSLTLVDLESGKAREFDRAACRFGYRDSIFKREGWHLTGSHAISAVTLRLPKAWRPVIAYAELATELDHRGLEQPQARQIADAVIAVRQRKLPDPGVLPNAGSFFHNPVLEAADADRLAASHPGLPRYAQRDGRVKLAAGWLIENAGWKGRELGAVGMYEKQALVLVNRGGAQGSEVIALMQAVQRDVFEKFGVELKPEPVLL
jgi:UDP-N-acetylmuramate dehydrogenase